MSNPLPFIMANAVLTILAGSDTTSSSMAMVFFNLLREPRCYKKLQKEIDDSVAEAGGSIPSMEQLAQLPYLNAVMYVLSFESIGGMSSDRRPGYRNEAMRLQAPVPTSVQRAPKVGSGGKMLGSMYVTHPIPIANSYCLPKGSYQRGRTSKSPHTCCTEIPDTFTRIRTPFGPSAGCHKDRRP